MVPIGKVGNLNTQKLSSQNIDLLGLGNLPDCLADSIFQRKVKQRFILGDDFYSFINTSIILISKANGAGTRTNMLQVLRESIFMFRPCMLMLVNAPLLILRHRHFCDNSRLNMVSGMQSVNVQRLMRLQLESRILQHLLNRVKIVIQNHLQRRVFRLNIVLRCSHRFDEVRRVCLGVGRAFGRRH